MFQLQLTIAPEVNRPREREGVLQAAMLIWV